MKINKTSLHNTIISILSTVTAVHNINNNISLGFNQMQPLAGTMTVNLPRARRLTPINSLINLYIQTYLTPLLNVTFAYNNKNTLNTHYHSTTVRT